MIGIHGQMGNFIQLADDEYFFVSSVSNTYLPTSFIMYIVIHRAHSLVLMIIQLGDDSITIGGESSKSPSCLRIL